MDRHAEWTKAQHELAEASKAAHLWGTMPSDIRARIGVKQYREKRTLARRRLQQADRLCRDVSAARRVSIREKAGPEGL